MASSRAPLGAIFETEWPIFYSDFVGLLGLGDTADVIRLILDISLALAHEQVVSDRVAY